MKHINAFWSRYAAGEFPTLEEFKAGVREAMTAQDADPNPDPIQHFLGRNWQELTELSHAPLSRLKFPSHFTSQTELAQHNRADWQQTDPRIQIFAATLIEVLRSKGIPMWVHSAFRTKAEQQAAFERGNSKLRWPRAAHCQGKAVDIVHGKFAWELTKQEWAHIGKIGKEVLDRMNRQLPASKRFALNWGGDWSFYDPAHWEIANWQSSIAELPTAAPVRKTPRFILRENRGR